MKIRDLCNFYIGWVVGVSAFALYTDSLGKEEYIRVLNTETGWLETRISVPLYMTFLFLSVIFSIKNNKN